MSTQVRFQCTVEFKVVCAICGEVAGCGEWVLRSGMPVPVPTLPWEWLQVPWGSFGDIATICGKHKVKIEIDDDGGRLYAWKGIITSEHPDNT